MLHKAKASCFKSGFSRSCPASSVHSSLDVEGVPRVHHFFDHRSPPAMGSSGIPHLEHPALEKVLAQQPVLFIIQQSRTVHQLSNT